MVFCTGHCVYMLVPGYGPYRHLAGQFEHSLSGGLFWRLVREAVDAGGAQKDIFPSLHTALPTYFALFSLKNRRTRPFNITFWIVAFFASQIICATMFLRWHYLVDICAGIVLAATAVVVPSYVIPWERKRRQALGVPPTFTGLWGKTE
jgi:membrane-associated phospholipid phosphatase